MICNATIWRDFYIAALRSNAARPSKRADIGLALFIKRFEPNTLMPTEYLHKKLMDTNEVAE